MPISKYSKKGASKTKKTKIKTKRKTTKYEECKKNIIGQDLRLFKQGNLKLRNKQPVTNRKQAIAIALSMAEKKCKDKKTKTDIRNENMKIRKNLDKSKYKEPLNSNRVREAIAKLKELKKEKKSQQYRTLKINLLSRIVMTSPISTVILRDIQLFLRNE